MQLGSGGARNATRCGVAESVMSPSWEVLGVQLQGGDGVEQDVPRDARN